jgi:hypothetical protein
VVDAPPSVLRQRPPTAEIMLPSGVPVPACSTLMLEVVRRLNKIKVAFVKSTVNLLFKIKFAEPLVDSWTPLIAPGF